ncbi:MAG: hypothetical protein PVI37_07245 [Gammaproteobacteria bacterium]|jgi:hypothetical protein
MSEFRLTLSIPGSRMAAPDSALPALPGLRRLVARARRLAAPPAGVAAGPAPAQGALAALGDSVEAGDRPWFRAEPVHLQVATDHLVLQDSTVLALADDEAVALIEAFNAFFEDDQARLVRGHSGAWYLSPGWLPDIRVAPLAAVIGRNIYPHMPSGPDAARWRSFLSEIEMLLHQQPVNAMREARGLPTVNSLWCWGGGHLPEQVAALPWDRLLSDDPAWRGLAELAGVPTASLPRDAADWLSREPAACERVILSGLELAAGHGSESWAETLERMDSEWFSPLLVALREAELERLWLDIDGEGWEVHRRDLRRFWRRRPLEEVLCRSAG